MNLATRILGVAIFVSVLAGATYGAFQAFGTQPQISSVEIQQPSQIPPLLAGQGGPMAFGVENTGNADVNLTLAADTDGFTLETRPQVQSITAGNSSRISGLLTAEAGLDGEYNVTVVASDEASGKELDSVAFNVTVTPPSPPELTLSTVLPAVLPGSNATVQAELTNTVDAGQRVNVSLAGGQGSVQPRQVSLRPGGSGSATVTVPVSPSASGQLDVRVRATNPAGQTVMATTSLSVVPDGEIAVEALEDEFTVRPGNRYSVPIVVVSNADVAGDVTASGADVVATNFTSIEPRSSTGGFATLEVPSGAPETLQQSVDVQIGDRNETVTLTVSTSASSDEMPSQGQQATVEYVGRTLEGDVFGTSKASVAQGPFAKDENFRGGRSVQPLTVRIGSPRQSAPPGVVSAVKNMTIDETRTVTLSPEEAFGPERRTQEMSATTELQRTQEVPLLLEDIPRNRLPAQFDIENRTEGEVIDFQTQAGDEEITLKFKLVEKGEETVTLERVAEEGETTTFYGPWPNATEVTKVNETTIVYTTTPPTSATDEPFTWDANPQGHKAKWGNSTLVQSVNETAIVLQHSPEEGLEYEASSGQFGQSRSYRVENVTNTTVTVSTPNQNPLGGQTLTFDLTVSDISEAQQRRLPGGLGGG